MGTQRVEVVACASAPAELDRIVAVTRAACPWPVTSVLCTDATALAEVRATARMYVLQIGRTLPDDVVDVLRDRPSDTALVVIGDDPCRHLRPTAWFSSAPAEPLLRSLFQQLVRIDDDAPGTTSWRRKSDMIIGHSSAIRQLRHTLDQLAPTQTPVIVTGESGVGKELVAQALHYCGPRASAPFIAINCAAIPENLIEAELFGYQRGAFTGAIHAHAGALEAANTGTLFLDEIGEMPLGMQAKLLRVLETSEVQRIGATERKRVDFRLVSATHRDLERAVREGRFREDLYDRIQVYPLHVPPLRERLEDIPAIATHHLSLIGAREKRPAPRLTHAAVEKLLTYPWPGNVRELVNLLERAVLVAGSTTVDADHVILPTLASTMSTARITGLLPYRDAKVKFELAYYEQLLRTVGGNISMAAKLGQKTRKEVYDALKRLGVDPATYRAST